MKEQNQPRIGIAKVYLKDMSFESPQAPMVFRQNWQPEIKLNVTVGNKLIQEEMYEVVLHLTIEAEDQGKVGFIVEIEQAGLFEVKDASEAQLSHILGIFCPTTLFPYARQAVDAALNLGGFPSLLLAPLNFESLHRQRQESPHHTHA